MLPFDRSHPRFPLIFAFYGGAMGGKDEAIDHVPDALSDYKIFTVDEPATMLMRAGMRPPGEAANPRYLREFQYLCKVVHERMLRITIGDAIEQGADAIICNRTAACGASFVPGGWKEWLEWVEDRDGDHHFTPYDHLIYFESLAVQFPDIWLAKVRADRERSRELGKPVNFRYEDDPQIVVGLDQRNKALLARHKSQTHLLCLPEGGQHKLEIATEVIRDFIETRRRAA